MYLWIFKDLKKRKVDTSLGLEKHKVKEILYVYITKAWPLFFWSFKNHTEMLNFRDYFSV